MNRACCFPVLCTKLHGKEGRCSRSWLNLNEGCCGVSRATNVTHIYPRGYLANYHFCSRIANGYRRTSVGNIPDGVCRYDECRGLLSYDIDHGLVMLSCFSSKSTTPYLGTTDDAGLRICSHLWEPTSTAPCPFPSPGLRFPAIDRGGSPTPPEPSPAAIGSAAGRMLNTIKKLNKVWFVDS